MSIREDIAKTIDAVRRAPYRTRHDAAWRVLEKIDRMEVTPTAEEEVFRIRLMVARALREEPESFTPDVQARIDRRVAELAAR